VTRYCDHVGYETDLMLIALDGRVLRRDGYWVGRRPRHPDHIWGNLLVLDQPPDPADPGAAARWIARSGEELGPAARHVALGWAGDGADTRVTAAFTARGFDAIDVVALSTSAPRPHPRAATGVTVRPLRSNGDWRACLALTRQMHDDDRPDPGFDQWLARQIRQHRVLTDQGHGAFFGAFVGPRLIGSLGIYVRRGDGLARYQLVVTDRRYRRRGVASRLVVEAGQHALAHLGARELVIVAERQRHAAQVYRDVGFDRAALQGGVMRQMPRRAWMRTR
jgi:GNAT superfamily N-acetyltransferase